MTNDNSQQHKDEPPDLIDECHALIEALKIENDLACILLSGSFLDSCLLKLLNSYFQKSSVTNRILNPRGGFLGNFAARCDLLYCLALISKPVYQNLMAIAIIRNVTAHSPLAISFHDEKIATQCLGLQFPQFVCCEISADGKAPSICTDPRERFALVVTLVSNRVLMCASEQCNLSAKSFWWTSED